MASAYKFQSLHEVPAPWRIYKGARLTLDQVQWIVEESFKQTGNNSGMASARQKFEENHRIENNLWVDGAPKGNK